jgi:Leucine-rich repeat (LRR) protein
MRRSVKMTVTAVSLISFIVAPIGAIDQTDSLTVLSILDQIGWTGVPVDSVYDKRISITSDTRVTNLTLSGRTGLPKIKQLPEAIGKLPELQSLSLAGNELSTLPKELTALLKLHQLNISSNAFTTLPDLLGEMTSLQLLDVSHNQIDSLPDFLGRLSNLMILDARANRIPFLPLEIKSLTGLKSLNLISNRLERLPEEIAGLTGLELLSCDSNMLVSLPLEITALQKVRIGVSGNRLCTLNEHHLTPEWRATQHCDDTGYSAIVTDLETGATVVFSSAFYPKIVVINAVTVASVATSAIPAMIPGGNDALKTIDITIDPVFNNQTNTFLITIPFNEERFANLDLTQLSVYHYDGQQWVYFGSTVNSTQRTISFRTGKEGMYAILYKTKRVPVRSLSTDKKQPFTIKLSSTALFLKSGQWESSKVAVSFYSLTGRVLSRYTIAIHGTNDEIAVKLPGNLTGKAFMIVVYNGKESFSRLLSLP